MPTIEVCQAGTCRAAGGERFKEIEELADGTGCSVNPTGCVGACNQAPTAAVLVQRGQEYLQTKIDTVEKSAALVEKACIEAKPRRSSAKAAPHRRTKDACAAATPEKKWNAASIIWPGGCQRRR